jgi:hypothetical protein
MSASLRKSWTREQFFAWAEAQDQRHEFNRFQPVATTNGTRRHSAIMRNLHRALDAGLRGAPCQWLGPDAGLATVGTAIRYPDALVTCSKLDLNSRTVPRRRCGVRGDQPRHQPDRPDPEVREYAAVPSIRRYAMLQSSTSGLTVLERERADEVWRTTTTYQ